MSRITELFTPSVRRYLYVVGLCLTALLTAYGIIDEEYVLLWNLLLAALLGMAIGHVPNDPNAPVEQDQLNLTEPRVRAVKRNPLKRKGKQV